MSLCEKLVAARKMKGLTQDELAELTKVTVRTIQRIESGETTPRSYTLKAIAAALDIPFEQLNPAEKTPEQETTDKITADSSDEKAFLQMLCLSCFSYLVIPYVHFLIPAYFLKNSAFQNPTIKFFGRRLIRQQVIWVILLNISLLLTLSYNLLFSGKGQTARPINYLIPVGIMYFLNAALLIAKMIQVKSWLAKDSTHSK